MDSGNEKITVEERKQRVRDIIEKVFMREDCPVCGLRMWNGNPHPYGGIYIRNKKEQHWCNGTIHFYPKRKEDLPVEPEKIPEQMELDFSKGC